MTDTTTTTPKELILKTAADLGLTMTAEFVPWSQSRNKGEKSPSLNWRVTIERAGHALLTTDYMAGRAHAPGYKQMDRSLMRADIVAWECENGKRSTLGGATIYGGGARLQPEFADVLYSLMSDCDVLDYPTYEEWAPEIGYDPDSRKGEAIYRACLETALKLRNGIGEDGMRRLREAGEGY